MPLTWLALTAALVALAAITWIVVAERLRRRMKADASDAFGADRP